MKLKNINFFPIVLTIGYPSGLDLANAGSETVKYYDGIACSGIYFRNYAELVRLKPEALEYEVVGISAPRGSHIPLIAPVSAINVTVVPPSNEEEGNMNAHM